MKRIIYDRQDNVIKIVDTLLHTAITNHVSDIHLEPTNDILRIRFRVDGILIDQPCISREISSQVCARLKVLAHINSTEKRMPQDGKMIFSVGDKSVDIRLSTFPSLYGEKIVVRILDRSVNLLDLQAIGLSGDMYHQFKKLLSQQSGFLLVTGPTGSGKTTTLYSALSALNTKEKNIVTLEDPVEYALNGITQAQINPKAGFTFESGIRSLLRQDPDILMVGEIRDTQTARIAIQAALTGHLVLSTIHTNDAPSVIMRLIDMGIEPFLISAALTGVLSQRLLRKLCANCCEVDTRGLLSSNELLNTIDGDIISKYAQGCNSCNNTGYKGRIGIFELLEISPELRRLIIHNPLADTIYAHAYNDGMRSLKHDLIDKIKQGVISIDEVIRLGIG